MTITLMLSTGYGYYVQAFYDFEIQGIANRFETPSIEADDTTKSLEQKGYGLIWAAVGQLQGDGGKPQ